MKKNILLTIALFLCFQINAQKEDHVWILGGFEEGLDSTHNGIMEIDFNETPHTIEKLYHHFAVSGTNVSIADSEGDLLCYSNGVDVYNSNHEIITNGQDFQLNEPFGFPFLQGALLLPYPEHEDQYFLITKDVHFFIEEPPLTQDGTFPLMYSIIDMGFNNGAGIVIEKKTIFNSDTLSVSQLGACRHANGRDWWILQHKLNTNQFIRFLLSPSGIMEVGSQTIGEVLFTGVAQTAYAPNGEWYAIHHAIGGNQLYIYSFDRCTGLLSNEIVEDFSILAPTSRPGLAFSSNSRFLYKSQKSFIYQYDLEASDILASKTEVAVTDDFTDTIVNTTLIYKPYFGRMQLAPDDKIYIPTSSGNSEYMHIIEEPDLQGTACNVVQHIAYPAAMYASVPNHPHYRLGALPGSPCDSLTVPTTQLTTTKPEIILYPNPSQDYVQIYTQGIPLNSEMIFYNTLGEQVKRVSLSVGETLELDLDLANGIYYYSVVGGGNVLFSDKVLVLRE